MHYLANVLQIQLFQQRSSYSVYSYVLELITLCIQKNIENNVI